MEGDIAVNAIVLFLDYWVRNGTYRSWQVTSSGDKSHFVVTMRDGTVVTAKTFSLLEICTLIETHIISNLEAMVTTIRAGKAADKSDETVV